jgi:hypothetical protein
MAEVNYADCRFPIATTSSFAVGPAKVGSTKMSLMSVNLDNAKNLSQVGAPKIVAFSADTPTIDATACINDYCRFACDQPLVTCFRSERKRKPRLHQYINELFELVRNAEVPIRQT